MEEGNEAAEATDEGGGFDIKIVRSYLSFARRAIKARKLQLFSVLLLGLIMTALVVVFIPRTYKVTTVLMTVSNFVLDGRDAPRPLAGANGLITRRENLELLIRQTKLLEKYPLRRPALLRLKDRVSEAVSGPLPEKIRMAILVGTLETKMTVEVDDDDNLNISVEWSDPETPTELAQAALDGFLKIRHKAEISAFQEKMGIVDTHASKLLQEIGELAEQLNAAAAAEAAKLPKPDGPKGASKRVSLPAAAAAPPKAPATDEQLPALKEKLATLSQKLSTVEGERSARIREERTKLEELKLKFTPNHPLVITQQERVGMASDVPSELALMRSEVQNLEGLIKQRQAMVTTGLQAATGATPRATTATADAEPALPAGVAVLLSQDEGDPAIKAQLAGAVIRYGALRDDVREAKMALDTAQAAYNHRYQVVIPVERPDKASKPNLIGIGIGGVFLALLLALLIPIVGELRRGVLVEYWQVTQFQLPVLAELRLPPGPEDR